jgi:hypothetical protein
VKGENISKDVVKALIYVVIRVALAVYSGMELHHSWSRYYHIEPCDSPNYQRMISDLGALHTYLHVCPLGRSRFRRVQHMSNRIYKWGASSYFAM